MAYVIIFEMDPNCYQRCLENEFSKTLGIVKKQADAKHDVNLIYRQIESVMLDAGFIRLRENMYRSKKDNADAILDAFHHIKTIHGFCVNEIYGFKMKGWCNLKHKLAKFT